MDDSTDDLWGMSDDAPPSPTAKAEQPLPVETMAEDDPWGMDDETPDPTPSTITPTTTATATEAAPSQDLDMWGEPEPTPAPSTTTATITTATIDSSPIDETTTPDDQAQQDLAAAKIQARARGRKQRREMQQQKDGAEKIQARFRGNYGRKRIQIQQDESKAASKIQARARGRNERKRLQERKEQDAAAAKIQARVRGRNQRGSKEKEEQNAAAAKIQARARGRKMRAEKAREQAAIAKIQAMERGRQTRKNCNVSLSGSDQAGEFAKTEKGGHAIDTTQTMAGDQGYFQNSSEPREYIFPSQNILVADTGIQTQLLPPDAPPRTPNVIIGMPDVLETYAKGTLSIFKAYTSKNGMNRTGHKATFEDIRKQEAVINRAGFNQICTNFKLVAKTRQKKRLNAQGKRIMPNAEGWYKLWSLLPSNEGEAGYNIAADIRMVNIQEIARAATGEPLKRRNRGPNGRSIRSVPKSQRVRDDSSEAAIRFGQTVETSGVVASVDVLPDDINTPPTISDNGEIPMTANTILKIFNSCSGEDNNFLGLDVNGLGEALGSIAYDGVRRLIPAEHLIRAEMKKNTARLAFFRQVLPTLSKLKWKPQFRHYMDFKNIKVFYEKSLRRQRRETRTHYTRSHHIFARVTKSWVPDTPTQRLAMTACKKFYKGSRKEDGSPVRLFQQGGMEINKDDVVHVICRRSSSEHEAHVENLKFLDLDPRFGLAGPGRFLEKDPSNAREQVKRRPGDWFLGMLVSYKGELIEEGTMSGWFPASAVEVVNIEADMEMYEEEAAEMMQAACRGHLLRNKQYIRWNACSTIQKIARGMVQRRRFQRAKYVLRGVAEAIISKRLMSLTKAQCAAALFNRMRMGAETQLRRRIMENNHGFAFGESANSAVKWSVNELETDLKQDAMLMETAASRSMYPTGGIKKTLTRDEERTIQRNKLFFTKNKDDVVNEMRREEDRYAATSSGFGMMNAAAMQAYGEDPNTEQANGADEDADGGNGLDDDESNWLDNIGLKGDTESNDDYMVRMKGKNGPVQYGQASSAKVMPPLSWDQLEQDANSANSGKLKGRQGRQGRQGNGTRNTYSTNGEFNGSARPSEDEARINNSNIGDNGGSINPNRAKPRALFVSKDGSPVLTWNEIEKINMNDLNNALGTFNPGQKLGKGKKKYRSNTGKPVKTSGYGRAAGAGADYGRTRNNSNNRSKVMSYNDTANASKSSNQSPLQAKRNLKKSNRSTRNGTGSGTRVGMNNDSKNKQPQAPKGRRVKFANKK